MNQHKVQQICTQWSGDNMYCVYITFYKGNKLPPYYIGHTNIDKINKGYCGSVKSKKYKNVWNQELINSKHLFVVKILKHFENKNDALFYEEYLQRKYAVHKNPMYINMAITNKKFVCTDHSYASKRMKKDNPNKNGMSEEHKRKISEANKGKKMNKEAIEKMRQTKIGKKQSKEHTEKVRKALLGRKFTPEWIEKIKQAKTGKKLVNGKYI